MIHLHLRDARDTDHVSIRNVTISAYQDYATHSFWEEYRRSILSTLMDIHPAEQIVAEHDGRIVGTVLLYPAGTVVDSSDAVPVRMGSLEIRLLAVAPDARGQGVGTALMQECIRRARQIGAPMLTLHTTEIMQTAMRLYERMGFVRAPDLDFHPAPNIIVKGYRLRLDAARP
jgi:GNAT superfamily N-acetyltransferase